MSATEKAIVEVRDLSKVFEDVRAVDGVDFVVYQGELFGFLGPNGAGKTTTINMLTGLARPTHGAIKISGIDCSKNPKAAQHLTGIVPDESNLYPELTGYENLCFCAALYGMKKKERQQRAKELLDVFGLSEAANRKFGAYSKGMKRKLTIAAGIIHRPQILFLDEPTTGIDVASARQIRRLISDLHNDGTSIFLTTHYIEEAERLCDRIAFIVQGKIVHVSKVEDLLQPIKDKHLMQFSFEGDERELSDQLQQTFPEIAFQKSPGNVIRAESDRRIAVGPLVRFFEETGVEITEARRMRPSLEDVFVKITGIEADLMKREKERRNQKS